MRSRNAALAVAEPQDAIDDTVAEAARLLASGEVDSAVSIIERVRARQPRDIHVRFLLALAAWRMHDLVGATNILRELCDEVDENGTFAETLATFRALVGDLNDALFLGKLGTALPPDPIAKSLIPPDFPSFGVAFQGIEERPLVRLSKVLAHQGWLQPATRALEQHVRLFPADIPAASDLAATLLSSGREAEVVQHVAPLVNAGDARSLSLLARASTAIGDREGGLRLHTVAAEAAPDDAEIAAALLRDTEVADPAAIEAWLQRFRLPPSPRALPPRAEMRRVGYLVAGVAGSPLAGLAVAVARRHDRERTEVYGYGYGELSADCNAELRGGFDTWRDISRIDPRTIGRILEGDGLDIVIDASGLRHPASLRALFATGVPRRCGWLGLPVITASAPYDCVLATEGEVVPGPLPSIALGPSAFAIPATPFSRKPAEAPRLGLSLLPREMTPQTIALLRRFMDADPQLRLVLRDHGLSLPIVVDRLIAQFGPDAGRIDLVKSIDPREFLEQLDLLLSPPSAETPRGAVEAMAHGVPVVIATGSTGGARAAAVAAALGLGECIASSPEDVFTRTLAMLRAPDPAWRRAAEAAGGEAFQGRRVANAIDALIPEREGHDAR